MSDKWDDMVILCPNGHGNTSQTPNCEVCGLPVINFEQEMELLIERFVSKSDYVVPHVDSSFIGIGTAGSKIVIDFYRFFGGDLSDFSFLNIDATPSSDIVPEINAKGVRFYQHTISETEVGGTIYSGLGEQAALRDSDLDSYLRMSGIRSDDPGQAIFVVTTIGGGTGSGMAPVLIKLCKSHNHDISIVALAVTPSSSEADYIHLNAFYGISRVISLGGETNADMVLLVNYDKLRHLRGVGRSGEDLKADGVIIYLLRLFKLDLFQSGIIRMCRISRGARVQVFIPCLAIGRSMAIFGNLTNVLESAGTYPLADVNFENVTASYLILRIPRGLAADFTREVVSQEFEAWNRNHVPNVTSSLVQILQTEEQSDRIDACILLGGDDLDTAIQGTIEGYRRFKSTVEKSARWEDYGLTSKGISEAEEILAGYNQAIQEVRGSKRKNRGVSGDAAE